MDQKWLILILATVTHVNLLLAFLPSYWDPVRRRGRRFSTLVVPLLVPVLFGVMLLVALLDHRATLPDWSLIVGGSGFAAATATLAISWSVLRSLGAEEP